MKDTTTNNLVFTYGTLRVSLYPHVEEVFGVKLAGNATLRGPFQMLDLGSFPGLVWDVALPTTGIYGEVVEASNLTHLDRYEGYNPNRPEGSNLYIRKEVAVKMFDGTTKVCWVYVYAHPPMGGGRVIKSGDWAKRGGV